MRAVLYAIAAFFFAAAMLAAGGYAALLFLWLLALTGLFFSERWGIPVLIGIAAAIEGLGSSRFGLAIIIGFLCVTLRVIFGDQLRFTGETARFVMASGILGVIVLVSAGGIGISSAWGTTLGLIALAAAGAYAHTGLARPDTHRDNAHY